MGIVGHVASRGNLTASEVQTGQTSTMDKIVIKRDGLPPLSFTGEQIASASSRAVSGADQNRWIEVLIFKTKGGKYVGHVKRLTRWEGERDTSAAASYPAAADLIEWLKEGESTLGRISQEAVEEAAKTDPAFATAWVEEIE